MSERVAIVLAWVDMSGLRLTGRYLDRYRMEPETQAVEAAKTCMWLNAGTAEDVGKAWSYAATMVGDHVRVAVYTFPADGPDPRPEAARMILADKGRGLRKPLETSA